MEFTVIISIIAIIVSIVSAQIANRSLKQKGEIARAQIVMHFTKSYFEFLEKEGKPDKTRFQDDDWIERFYGLHSTEFYYFDHGTIPAKMYSLWMTDVADMYAENPGAWNKHKTYLESYGIAYSEMETFFTRLYELSQEEDRQTRRRKVIDYVKKEAKEQSDMSLT